MYNNYSSQARGIIQFRTCTMALKEPWSFSECQNTDFLSCMQVLFIKIIKQSLYSQDDENDSLIYMANSEWSIHKKRILRRKYPFFILFFSSLILQ